MKEGEEKLNKDVANFQLPASLLKKADEIAKNKAMTRSAVLRQAIRIGLPAVEASA